MEEGGACDAIDPWGGSYYVERLTHELIVRAQAHLKEIEELGGMAKAIELGVPKRRIEEAALRTQSRIDSGEDILVGVNRFSTGEAFSPDLLKIDQAEVLEAQKAQLAELRHKRDEGRVQDALSRLRSAAKEGDENLLACAMGAARAHATVGEISLALETVFGRHLAPSFGALGVYGSSVTGGSEKRETIARLVDSFQQKAGRRPRILVAKIGQDGQRSRSEDHCECVCRPWLRRRFWHAVSDAR